MLTQMQAFEWTLALELPAYAVAWWIWRLNVVQVVSCWLLASTLTHPLAWHAALDFSPQTYHAWGWAWIETVVTAVEAGVIRAFLRKSWLRALGLSIASNLTSALA